MNRIAWILIATLLVAEPLRAQESGPMRVMSQMAACGVFAGSTVIAADILVEDWSGLILGIALSLAAGSSSRYCLYGPGVRPLTLYARLCDQSMMMAPILGVGVYAGAGGNLENELATALVIAGSGLAGGVVREKTCPELGGHYLPPIIEEREWGADAASWRDPPR
jgi:hypothetical protein